VSLVTLGCARNEVDSEELAARLEAAGWDVAGEGGTAGPDENAAASVVIVNTCGFIQAAKEESISELLGAAGEGRTVVAAGCLAERYGTELAEALPEAEVLSFDDYPGIGERLDRVLAGERRPAHVPRDRRALLPLAPADRPRAGRGVVVPGHHAPAVTDEFASRTAEADPPLPAPASGPRVLRRRLAGGTVAPLKIASGCDRRCSFCAIPSFRGSFVSRPVADLIAEARWLAGEGVRELVLVSENSTSYGKDLGNLRLLEELLPALAAVPGIARVRVSYLQPAEMRPSLVQVMTCTPGVAPYFDLSFQHASGPVLRAMRRFGDRERFAALLGQIRGLSGGGLAGVRSNFIVGFPGESRADLDELKRFLDGARLDAIGIFGYSDEDGTEAASLPGKLDEDEIAARVAEVSGLAEELMAQRGQERVGEDVEVLLEDRLGDGQYEGRAAHQAPEVDGTTTVRGDIGARPGDLVRATVREAGGVDLVADAIEIISSAGTATMKPTGRR
jgi:ribosomal protein S12 methylthiotransferase RimO